MKSSHEKFHFIQKLIVKFSSLISTCGSSCYDLYIGNPTNSLSLFRVPKSLTCDWVDISARESQYTCLSSLSRECMSALWLRTATESAFWWFLSPVLFSLSIGCIRLTIYSVQKQQVHSIPAKFHTVSAMGSLHSRSEVFLKVTCDNLKCKVKTTHFSSLKIKQKTMYTHTVESIYLSFTKIWLLVSLFSVENVKFVSSIN